MKSFLTLLFFFSTVFTLDAQTPDSVAQESQEGYATVYFYRTARGNKEEVKILEHNIVWKSERNTKGEFKVPAGIVTLYTKAGPEVPCEIKVMLESGQTYYVKNYFKIGFIAGRSMVEVVPNNIGEKEYNSIK